MDKEKANRRLLHAISVGDVAAARAVLDGGADVNAKDKDRLTPLHWAVWHDREDLVRLLIDKGADVHAQDLSNETPLHHAAAYGQIDIARLLIEYGADVNANGINQESPLSLARGSGYIETVELLERAAKQQQRHAARIDRERRNTDPTRGRG